VAHLPHQDSQGAHVSISVDTKVLREDRNPHGAVARISREIGPLSSLCRWLLERGPIFQ
jgi:hypothetical protein